ncbi:nad p h oxidoreductase-related [Anaeramoeba flamelloides]|uniref:Nad p h oxidoreductase-related n=1 Tax=Anaeramoeba flamelloides TaxID=1746091 RepID=A0AAV7ZBS5_9EUKA|nr:nad p h oxidoreductase-related [Anaeramoeba flamelloides]
MVGKVTTKPPAEDNYVEIFDRNQNFQGMGGLPFIINTIDFVDANGSMMDFQIEIDLNNKSPTEADFDSIDCGIYYKSTLVGDASITNTQLFAGHNIFNFESSLNGELNNLKSGFISMETLALELKVSVTCQDASDSIEIFNTAIEIKGFDGIPTAINSFDLNESTSNTLELELDVTINNPSDIGVDINQLSFDLYYQSTYLGEGFKGQLMNFPRGDTPFLINITLDGTNEIISEFLGDYISGFNLTLVLESKITIQFNSGSNWLMETQIDVGMGGIQEDLISIDVQEISILPKIFPIGVSYDIDFEITIHNPLKFEFQIKSFTGPSYFNDTDSSSYLIIGPYSAKNDLYIYDIDMNWTDSPVSVTGGGEYQEVSYFQGTNIELGIRLLDEYQKNQLYVDLKAGDLTLIIGDYETTSQPNITMKVLIVFAHPESKSFNAALKNTAVSTLTEAGHEVKVSDLYEIGWNFHVDRTNFTELKDNDYFKPQSEQPLGKYIQKIKDEQAKVTWCDMIIFQFPMYWYSMPSILKSWVDIVFSAGFAYGGDYGYFEKAGFAGKKALICTTTGGPEFFYTEKGRSGNYKRILYPIIYGMFVFTGMESYEPQVFFGPAHGTDESRKEMLKKYSEFLKDIDNQKFIPFNKSDKFEGQMMTLKENEKTNIEIIGDEK